MSKIPDRFLDIDLPEFFNLEVPFDESPTGWIVDVGSLTPDSFDRLDDGTYLCAGYGGHAIYLRVVKILEGGEIDLLDGGGDKYRCRIRPISSGATG